MAGRPRRWSSWSCWPEAVRLWERAGLAAALALLPVAAGRLAARAGAEQAEQDVTHCNASAGMFSDCPHLGGGAHNFSLSSCLDQMRELRGDTINYKETGACWIKRCASRNLHYSDRYLGYAVYSTKCQPCARPSDFCRLPSSSFNASRDCDRDGITDPFCQTAQGNSGYFGSADDCEWSTGTCSESHSSFFEGFKRTLEHSALGGMVKHMEDEEHQLATKLGPAEKAVSQVYEGMNRPDYNAPPTLQGNSLDFINRMVLTLVVGVAGITSLAGFVDVFYPCRALEGRPKLWATTMLTSSYLLLIPGLTNVLLSFAIIVNVIGHRIRVHPEASNPSCTESTPGLVHLLYDTGGRTGAILIVFFAMVVPALELVLLTIGEIFRFRNCPCCAQAARMVIVWVQHRSKWASPDTFAYILLVYLIRSLHHYPLILTKIRLDIGFTCFSFFCVCATVSSMGFPLPPLPEGAFAYEEARPPLTVRCLGRRGVVFVALVFVIAFSILLGIGMTIPIMAFRINERPLYQPVGPLPVSAKPAVNTLAIPQMLNTEVNLWNCITALFEWSLDGEANSMVALAMWSIFVVGFTVLDMLMLFCAALRLLLPETPKPCPFIAAAKAFKRLAMLDVAIVGVVLVTFCMAIYKKIGVLVSTRKGLYFLLAAEIVHNVAYFVVANATDTQPGGTLYAKAEGEDDDGSPRAGYGAYGVTCCISKKLFARRSAVALPLTRVPKGEMRSFA